MPWWDYDAPGTRRDTTAGAVLSSGLLELARVDPDADHRSRWRAAGMRTLRSLVGPRYLARGTGAWSVLLHGRHNPTYDDSGVTYGDHYLLEALLRVELLPATRPALRTSTVRRGPQGSLRVDLGGRRSVSAVSVRWPAGAPTRFRIQTSRDGRSWSAGRGGVSSGMVSGLETYDLRDRAARYVRVRPLGAADGGTGGRSRCASAADRVRLPVAQPDDEAQAGPGRVDRAHLVVDQPGGQTEVAHDVLVEVGGSRWTASARRPRARPPW